MRKILFWSAAILFAAISCNKEIDAPAASEEGPVTFTATVDGVDTKTVLGADKTPMWSGYELITVHNGTKGFTFETNAAEPALTANFSYNGDDFTGGKVLAVYPSGEYTVDVDNKTVEGINIPNPQILVADTYQTTAAFAAAYSEDNTLQFRNAVALLAFQVADADITKGSIYAVDGGDLTGKYKMTLSNVEGDGYDFDVPVLTATAANAWADFKLENDAALAIDKTYYVAVAPGTFPKGFAVSINGKEVRKTTKEVTFQRNVIYNLGLLELPEEVLPETWYVSGTMDNWSLDNPMTLEGDWYVAKNITVTTDDMFKFRSDKNWTNDRGHISEAAVADKEYAVKSGNDGNIKVAVSAVYDIYLHKDATKMKIVKVADYVKPTITTLYFKPSSNWKEAGAWFAAWTWGGAEAKWCIFDDADGDGCYQTTLLDGTTGFKIVRMNPAATEPAWESENGKWAESGNINIPSDGSDLFTMNDGWDCVGTWSTYAPAAE